MLKIFSTISLLFTFALTNAQTATNFNCNDCAGNNHDLFTELDAGKVIVIAWVMPCSSCLPPTLTASNIVQSYASSNPGQVFLYVVDDYANTNCTSLGSWCTSNGITGTTFSNSAIDMLDYGSAGMPKIVVLGGTAHTVFFNQNNTAAGNSTAIQQAIDAALAVTVQDPASPLASMQVAPNPASTNATLTVNMSESSETSITVYNTPGQQVMTVYSGTLVAGETKFELNLNELAAGSYYIQVTNGTVRRTLRFTRIE